MLGDGPVARFVASAKSDADLWAALTGAAATLGEKGHLIGQEFLCQGFTTSNRSPWTTVWKLFRLSAHGLLANAPAIPKEGLDGPSGERWLNQAYIDLAPWRLLTKDGRRAKITELGRVFLEEFSPDDVLHGEPEGRELAAFNFRFFKVIEKAAFDDPPTVWRAAKQQADRMAEFAVEKWAGETLAPDQIALLDFLSCSTLRTRGGTPVNILRWRQSWAASSTLADWTEVARHLSRVQGRLTDPDGKLLAPLLWRYFKRDEKGSPRIISQSYDTFRFLLNAPNVGEADVDVPPDVRPVVTRSTLVKVRQRSEPDRLKEKVGYKCQLCGGAIVRKDDHPYVEAAHLRPFAGLSEDGIPGNYLIVCAHHHKAIDVGSPIFSLDPTDPPQFATVEVQEMDGSRKTYRIIPHPRQARFGFWDAVKWRVEHPS